jgi:hypothetical protein
MNKETITGIIAILIIAGAVASLFLNEVAAGVLIPIASFIIGYYFKTNEHSIGRGIKTLFKESNLDDCGK